MTARAVAVAWSVKDLARRGAFALALAAGAVGTSPAQAQFFNELFGPRMSSREIDSALRDRGLEAAARPRLVGDVYVVHAINRRGERVRVLVDAYEGRVVETTVLLPPGVRLRDYDAGPRRVRRREEFDGRPPGLVPGGRLEARRPDGDDIAPRVIPAPDRKPETRRPKPPRRPATAARQPPPEADPKPAARAVPDLPPERPVEATKPDEDKTAARPPVSEPKAETPKKSEKGAETAARPPATEWSEPAPAAPEKQPVTAARPPAASEPEKPEPPAKPTATEKPASSTAAATPRSPGSIKVVPPAPLEESRSATKPVPAIPPVQSMD